MTQRRILTLADVAAEYSVSRQTVHAWIADGLTVIDVGTPHDKASGRRLPRLFWADLVEYYVGKRMAQGRYKRRGPDKTERKRKGRHET